MLYVSTHCPEEWKVVHLVSDQNFPPNSPWTESKLCHDFFTLSQNFCAIFPQCDSLRNWSLWEPCTRQTFLITLMWSFLTHSSLTPYHKDDRNTYCGLTKWWITRHNTSSLISHYSWRRYPNHINHSASNHAKDSTDYSHNDPALPCSAIYLPTSTGR